jgi:hypothetical protein
MGRQRLSKSNYSVDDIFVELEKNICEADFEPVNHWTLELINSNQVKACVNFIIGLFARCFMSKNVYFVELVASKLALIRGNKFSSKKKNVQNLLCELTLHLAAETPSNLNFDQYARYKEYVSSDLVQRACSQTCVVFEDIDDMGNALLKSLLVYMVRGDFKTVMGIVFYFMEAHPRCVSYLWKVLQTPKTDVLTERYLKGCMEIFECCISDRLIPERMHILYVCFYIVTKRKELVCTRASRFSINADKKIDYLRYYVNTDPEKEHSFKMSLRFANNIPGERRLIDVPDFVSQRDEINVVKV